MLRSYSCFRSTCSVSSRSDGRRSNSQERVRGPGSSTGLRWWLGRPPRLDVTSNSPLAPTIAHLPYLVEQKRRDALTLPPPLRQIWQVRVERGGPTTTRTEQVAGGFRTGEATDRLAINLSRATSG